MAGCAGFVGRCWVPAADAGMTLWDGVPGGDAGMTDRRVRGLGIVG